jgi:hypothetical protein
VLLLSLQEVKAAIEKVAAATASVIFLNENFI